MTESDRKPNIQELRKIIDSPIQVTGRFNLKPSVELAIPKSEAQEDQGIELRELANEVFKREIDYHPNLKTNRQKMRFIQKQTFNWAYSKLALHLGISANEVRIFDQRGLKEKQLDKFRERFEGLFSIASILNRHVPEVIDRRGTLVTPNGLLSELGVGDIIKDGKINIAVAICEKSFKKFHEEN